MNRKSINPWDWGLQFSMNQAEIVTNISRHLICSGQVSLRPDPQSEMGVSVVAPNDIRGQMEFALANVEAVLNKANMDRKNILSLRFFTTDIDGFLANYDVYSMWISDAGIRPPQSLLGVERLILPELVIEIEVTAGE